jgi:hypothetical protein
MEVMGIVTSVENNVENGRLKSIATIRFNSDFSGGSLKAEAINNDGEYAGMSLPVEVRNNQ